MAAFDFFHDGHRFFLEHCRTHCTYLIVAVNSDASVRRLKGDSRPINPLADRISDVQPYADAVIPFEGDEGFLLMAIRPKVIFKGYDHNPGKTFIRSIGWKRGLSFDEPEMVHIPHLPGFSTTALIG